MYLFGYIGEGYDEGIDYGYGMGYIRVILVFDKIWDCKFFEFF